MADQNLVIQTLSGAGIPEDYQEQVELEGVTYTLRFRWNTRAETWFIDVLTEDGGALVLGLAVVADTVISAQHHAIDGFPAGEMLPYDTTARQEDPALTELGDRVLLLYLETAST